jgi:hypothetical protein
MSDGSGLGWLVVGGLGVAGVGLLWTRRAVASTKDHTSSPAGPSKAPLLTEDEPVERPVAETSQPPTKSPTAAESSPVGTKAPPAPPVSPATPVSIRTPPSSRYAARAKRLLDSIPKRIERTRRLIARWPTYLDRYRGGLPRGVFAAIMQMESDGKTRATGDRRLGEYGLFQITEELPDSLGFDPALRYQTEWNFFFGGREYNDAALRWQTKYPKLVRPGSKDAWLLARLAFAIGDGGAASHVRRALKALPEVARDHGVYAALLTFAEQGGARKAGSQSAELVAYRIALCPVNFEIGQQAEVGTFGEPVKLSPPRR